jgi:hypothetical protein
LPIINSAEVMGALETGFLPAGCDRGKWALLIMGLERHAGWYGMLVTDAAREIGRDSHAELVEYQHSLQQLLGWR